MSNDTMLNEGPGANQSDRDGLYAIREVHISSLLECFDEFGNEEHFQSLSRNELRVQKKYMEKHFHEMEQAHVLYRQCCLISSDDIYKELERKVKRFEVAIDDRIEELTSTSQSSIEQSGFRTGEVCANSSVHPGLPSVIRVETARPPQIGTFNGNPADWPAFRDLFIAEVHNKDFEPVTKLLYLQGACIERAAEKLGPWQPIGDNYRAAWDVMLSSYNDDYHVIHGLVGKFLAVQRQEKASHGSISCVSDALTNCRRQLRAINKESETLDKINDQLWIHLAKLRLDKHTLDSWERHRNQSCRDGLPTCEEFQKFLETRAKGQREYEPEVDWTKAGGKSRNESYGNRPKPYDRDNNRAKSYDDRNRFGGGEQIRIPYQKGCVVRNCKMNHPAWKCELFGRLPLAERRDLANQHRLCRCCLSPGHMSMACNRDGCAKCPESKFKHHFRLCPKTTDNGGQNVNAFKRTPETSTQ